MPHDLWSTGDSSKVNHFRKSVLGHGWNTQSSHFQMSPRCTTTHFNIISLGLFDSFGSTNDEREIPRFLKNPHAETTCLIPRGCWKKNTRQLTCQLLPGVGMAQRMHRGRKGPFEAPGYTSLSNSAQADALL